MTRHIAILQARLGSTRFPRKVLEPLDGVPMLQWVVDRVRQAARVDEVVVATSTAAGDDPLHAWCVSHGVACHRGSESDVLARFVSALAEVAADAEGVIRVNCDNPFVDPAAIDQLIDADRDELDYLSFALSGGRPVMLSAVSFYTEWIRGETLRRASRVIQDPHLREHVTLGIYQQPETYRVAFMPVPAFADDPDLRLTVDHPEDLELLRQVLAAAGGSLKSASAAEIAAAVTADPRWAQWMRQANQRSPKA